MYVVNRPFKYTNASGETVNAAVGAPIPEAEKFPTLRALLNLGWVKKSPLAPASPQANAARSDEVNLRPRRKSRHAPVTA